jgi:hypothetical protein
VRLGTSIGTNRPTGRRATAHAAPRGSWRSSATCSSTSLEEPGRTGEERRAAPPPGRRAALRPARDLHERSISISSLRRGAQNRNADVHPSPQPSRARRSVRRRGVADHFQPAFLAGAPHCEGSPFGGVGRRLSTAIPFVTEAFSTIDHARPAGERDAAGRRQPRRATARQQLSSSLTAPGVVRSPSQKKCTVAARATQARSAPARLVWTIVGLEAEVQHAELMRRRACTVRHPLDGRGSVRTLRWMTGPRPRQWPPDRVGCAGRRCVNREAHRPGRKRGARRCGPRAPER